MNTPPIPRRAMALAELVPLVATMVSLVALSIDAILPALPAIGRDLALADPNDAQLMVGALLLGLGIGQIVYGPASDRFGRKPAIGVGFALFMAGCALCIVAADFRLVLLGRVLQGAGAAGPRIVTVALVRDQYSGREMARVMSFVMGAFILVPALAPAIGQGILALAGWRAIFVAFLAMASFSAAWFAIRHPETLPPERRVPLSAARIAGALREVLTTRAAIGYTLTAGFVFSAFLGYLSSAQQVFQDTYGAGGRFPLYFALLALAIGAATVTNGRLVLRHGMRALSRTAITSLAALSLLFWIAVAATGGVPPFWLFMGYFGCAFFAIGILFGNLNALAMEPLGHIAGVGAAAVGSITTVISVPFGTLVGQAYDGTVHALAAGFAIFSLAAAATMRWAAAGAGR